MSRYENSVETVHIVTENTPPCRICEGREASTHSSLHSHDNRQTPKALRERKGMSSDLSLRFALVTFYCAPVFILYTVSWRCRSALHQACADDQLDGRYIAIFGAISLSSIRQSVADIVGDVVRVPEIKA